MTIPNSNTNCNRHPQACCFHCSLMVQHQTYHHCTYFSGFLKFGIPNSPWLFPYVSILKWSIRDCLYELGNLRCCCHFRLECAGRQHVRTLPGCPRMTLVPSNIPSGKPQENHRKMEVYPLVMTNIAIENGHRNSGLTHLQYVSISYVKLPEGILPSLSDS